MDYLGMGEYIASRIHATIPTLHIAYGDDLATITKGDMPRFPAAFVLYLQDDDITDVGDGGGELVTQRWQVVLAVREVSDTRTPQKLLQVAGPLYTQLIQALRGWTPDVMTWSPLRRQPAGPAHYAPGLLFLFLEFVTTFEETPP